ncbi:MAG: H-NS histone family protein [Rhodobacteraceae bacterium]|nr:H-NS histone family protein [Paracoccaceae bacterium]
MKPDLKSMTERELQKLRGDVDKALSRIQKTKVDDARKAAAAAAKKFGFSLDEIVGGQKPVRAKKPKTKSAPKYRNPKDASQTWTGRGRQPGWIKDILKAGKSLDTVKI